MKQLLQILLGLALITPLSLKAQENNIRTSCGTSIAELKTIVNNMDNLRIRYKDILQVRVAVAYVPLTFNVVGTNAGLGRVSKIRLLDLLDAVNKIYADNGVELQFYLKGFKDINNDVLYYTPRTLAAYTTAQSNKAKDALNVFICNSAGATQNDGTLAFYTIRNTGADYETDWIVLSKTFAASTEAHALAHELGHFFSLPHTFHGWEVDPFHPTTDKPCAPTIASDGFTLTELASRESDGNCKTAADKFCDTPADYNFGFTQGIDWNNPSRSCVYNGIAKDPTCIAINPDETNLMGYFVYAKCQSKFSPEQKAAIIRDYLQNPARQYLRAGNMAPYLGNMPAANLLTPANASTTSVFNRIVLDWADVANAVEYIVDFIAVTDPNDYRSFRTTTSTLTLTEAQLGKNYLTSNATYKWRVRAYNSYKTGTTSPEFTFKTGVLNDVKEIEGVSDFQIAPNPVGKERHIILSFNNEKSFDGMIKIYNTTGQMVHYEKDLFSAGLIQRSLDLNVLNNGLYIMSIESHDRVLKKKFMVED
jgi:hypothetical protein